MPSLTILDSKTNTPTELFYQDSGVPDLQVYTTFVIVHGLHFHSALFKLIFPFAASKGVRVVCLNRRDYPGTTPYSPGELKALSEGNADELKARGVELALFLDGLIDTLSLPGPSVDENEGGLAIMGWSMGNIFTLSTVASVSSLEPQVQARLQSYLQRLIVFDPPTWALGIPSGPEIYVPLSDETIPQAERLLQFAQWVSSYFTHGDLSTRSVDNIEYKVPNKTRNSVVSSLAPEELNSLVDYEAPWRSDIFLLTMFETPLFNQTCKALFDPATRSLWPNLGIWVLYCDSSPGIILHAAWDIEKLAKANKDQPVHFSIIEDAHHLVFWNEPERAMEAFERCLRH